MNSGPYILQDSIWSQLGAVLWIVVALAATTVFAVLIAQSAKKTLMIILGVAAVAMVVGGFCVQSGQGVYTDDEGMWACPSGMSGVQIENALDRPLPDGIASCREDSQRNLTVGLVMAGAGLAITGIAVAMNRKHRNSEWHR